MGLHIHIHNHPDTKTERSIELLHKKLDILMTKQERFDAILTRLDTVTTDIAGDFSTFVKEVREGTVSEESLAKAETNIATLEQLAATKENPVPGEQIPPVDQPAEGGDITNKEQPQQ